MTDFNQLPQTPEQPNLLERIHDLGTTALEAVQDFYHENKYRAATLLATGAAAMGGTMALEASPAGASGHRAASEGAVVHAKSSLNTQTILNKIQHESISSNTWAAGVKPQSIQLGKPISGFMNSNSAGYADSCKQQGLYWQYRLAPDGSFYDHCGPGIYGLLEPIGHSNPGEFNGKLDGLGHQTKQSINLKNKAVEEAIHQTRESTASVRGNQKEVTVNFRCPANNTTSTDNEGLATKIKQDGIRRITLTRKGNGRHQHTNAMITTC